MTSTKKSIPLKDLKVYQLSHEIGKRVSEIVSSWNHFHKDTLGKQFIRSADSISLNICEGFGRFYYKENKLFCYYSRGSLVETAECLVKARERNLVSESDYIQLAKTLKFLKITLNRYIASIGKDHQTFIEKKSQRSTNIN